MASINEKVRRGEDQGSRTGRKDKIRKGARRLCFTLEVQEETVDVTNIK
jgi:mRNA-degrading endonuclease RelE of RelBE toxin-antitoxin system